MKASSTSYIARFDTLTSTVKLVTWIALIAFLLPTSIGRPADAAPPIQEDEIDMYSGLAALHWSAYDDPAWDLSLIHI